VADPVSYGGQAVIEGVMMRGPRHFAVACRKADGEIVVREEPVPAFFTRYRWARWPFLRGVFALADSVGLGMKALLYSANLAMEDQLRPKPGDDPPPPAPDPLTQALLGPLFPLLGITPSGTIGGLAVTGSAISGLLIGLGLFMLLPSAVAGWVVPGGAHPLAKPVTEGVVRVLLVLGYIATVGRMKEVRRVFQYHGAEHKAINALEMEGSTDLDAVARASRIHPRCGTNFVLTVLLVKAIVFAVIPWQNDLLLRLLSRLALLPVVGSVAYEVIRLAGRHRNFAPLQWLVAPGLATQLLTTREPDRGMLEVAVASLDAVRKHEAPPDPAIPDSQSPTPTT
jgi:uncharacterized protein YqhQ